MKKRIVIAFSLSTILNSTCMIPPKPTVEHFLPIIERSGGTIFNKMSNNPRHNEKHPFTFSEEWLKIDGQRLNVFQYISEKENARPILFMNTLLEPNSSSTDFAEFMSVLGYHIFMIDFAGTGRSEGKRGVFSVEQNLRTIDALIGYAGGFSNKKPIYIGSSHGGEMGYLHACSKNSDRVGCYVLHGVFIPSLDVAPYDAKLALARTEDGRRLIREIYPDRIPLFALVDPMKFYGSRGIFVEEIAKNDEYGLEVDTKSYLDFIDFKPGRLNPNVPIVITATQGDKVVDYKSRTVFVFDELSKMSDNIEWYEPGTEVYPDVPRTSKFIPHMAFDTHYMLIAKELNSYFENGLD